MENRDGDAVDPVPFGVVSATGVLVAYSFVPGYLLTFGVPLWIALLVATGTALGTAGFAYHRFVVTGRAADTPVEIPVAYRLERLVYGGLVVALLLAALSALHYL